MVNTKHKQKQSSKTKYISLVIIAIILGLVWYFLGKNEDSSQKQIENGTVKNVPNSLEPTEEEMSAGDQQKQLNETREKIDSTTPATTQALPIITFAEQIDNTIEVGAFVNGIYEDGGTCKLIATKDQLVYTKDVQSIKNVQSTDCQTFNISTAELEPGIWEITVEYASPTASGKSDIRKITVH